MKTVFNNHSEVAHVWAQRSQKRGEAGNIFFEGDKIYSYGYHYEIARFEKNHVLLNNIGYSNSTSKHIGHVWSAVSHYKIFRTTNVNPEHILNEISEAWEKIQVARKPDLYYNSDFLSTFKEYLKEFSNKEQRDIKRKYKKELYKIRGLQKRLDNLYNANNTKELIQENKRKQREETKRKKAALLKANKEIIKKWRSFEKHSLPYNIFLDNNQAILRVNKETKQVETSKGIKIDLKPAITLFKLIEAGKDVKGYKIDYYTVISMNGALKVGCHTIDKKEVFKTGEILKKMEL